MGSFFKPAVLKMVFLAEWAAFVLLELLQGKLGSSREILITGYPFLFFYLVASILTRLSRRSQQLAGGWKLPSLTLSLIVIDQLSKAMVTAFVPYQTAIPIINGWMHLAHERNYQGSWLLSVFDWQLKITDLLAAFVVLFLLCSIFCYRYYVSHKRQSVWADVAFIGLFAGLMSWLCDMSLRGYIVDYIGLPGVVTADFKDILLTIGIAALFVEFLDNPDVSRRWRGWRTGGRELRRLAGNVALFSIQELCGIWQVFVRKAKKGPDA